MTTTYSQVKGIYRELAVYLLIDFGMSSRDRLDHIFVRPLAVCLLSAALLIFIYALFGWLLCFP